MNSETYQELFHYGTSPVFAVSKNGRVIYKNLACAKYLPEIYGSTGVKNKIYSEFPRESKPVRLLSGSSYSIALALMDGENVVFLCFSRFQCADGILVAERFLKAFGPNLSDFLVKFRKMATSKIYHAINPYFADEDLLSFVQDDLGFLEHQAYSLSSVLTPVFKRLNESFETMGYCFSAKIEKDFPGYLPVQISINDFLFLLGKLVYLMMKFSSTCQVDAILFSEIAYSRHRLRLETPTNLKNLPQTEGDRVLLLEKLMPECAAEIDLLNQIGFMKNADFLIDIDALGTLTVTYNFPYPEPEWQCVKSVEDLTLPILGNIENMIYSIMMKFKDRDAFC